MLLLLVAIYLFSALILVIHLVHQRAAAKRRSADPERERAKARLKRRPAAQSSGAGR